MVTCIQHPIKFLPCPVPMLLWLQEAAVMTANDAPVMLLTGAAGCGKTFVTKAILSVYQKQGKTVRLLSWVGSDGLTPEAV